MVSAFVLINCNLSFVPAVVEALNRVHAISDVYQTSGIYDILIKVNSASEKELRKTLLRDVCTIPDVRSTITMVIA